MRFQPALGVDGGHTARPRSGDGLAIDPILHITTGENAFYIGIGGVGLGDKIAILLHVEDVLE